MSSHVSCVKVNSTAVMLNNLEDSCNVSSDNANSSQYTMSNNADVSFINISNVQANSGEKNIDCNTNEGVDQVIQCDLHLVSIDQCDANSMHVTPDQNAYYDIRCEWLLLASMVIDMFACYLLMEKTSIPSTWFTGKGFKCACLNINRLLSKLDQVKLCIDEQKPNIFGLCETFLNDNVPDRILQINGYGFERRDRIGKAGGGILCYIGEDVKYKRRNDLEDDNIENIWLEVMYACSKNILIGFIYRPPNCNANWFDTFGENLEKLYHEDKDVILMGDMNIDLLSGTPSSNVTKLLHMLESVHLTQVITEPTRVTANSSTLIDHVYVSNPQTITHQCVPMYAISDHYPVCITRRVSKMKGNSKHISYRNMKNLDVDNFMLDMFNAPWDNVNQLASPNEALATWSTIYQDIIDKHMPVVQKKVKHSNQPNWISSEIKNAMYTRDFLKKAKNHAEYKIWRNKVVNLIKGAKRKFYVEAIESNKRNPTVLWRHMKGICPDKQKKGPDMLQVDNDIVTDSISIANGLNSYFTSVSQKYLPEPKTGLDSDSVEAIRQFVDSKVQNHTQFSIPPVNTEFVRKQLESMSNSKATGLDGFSIQILKLSAPAIIASITKICNLSIETGIFPDKWKEARVTPLYKGGEKDQCSNYRPISVLPVLSKILEKHVFVHMYEFLQQHELLVNTQFGFRKHQSCQTALLSLTEKMYKAINEGKYIGMIQLDLSKAFDLVNHSLLLQKLELYRCNNSTIKWFSSYLRNRTQRVSIKNKLSEPNLVTTGVPQGSILGPLSFLLQINDLPLFLSEVELLLIFADDTTVAATGTEPKIIEKQLNKNVKNVSKWCNKNDMVVSLPKSSSMLCASWQRLLHTDINDTSLNIELEGNKIPCVSTTKLLGVHFDQHLSWNEHIKHVHKKIRSNLYLLKQIKKYLPIDARKLFFNSYVLPHFDYCCTVWGNCSKTALSKLVKLQKRAARLILNTDYNTRSRELFT